MKSIKILVCCHKDTPRIKDDIFTPILLGAYYADKELKTLFKDDLWDCTGENIGYLHPFCAELTAVYWAWKNYDKLGSPDYIGLFHYRRMFNFLNEIHEKDNWKCAFFDFSDATRNRFGWNAEAIEDVYNGQEIILPHREKILDPYDWKTPATLETHYKHSHYPNDFDVAFSYVKSHLPEYSDAADRTAQSETGYFCNMFIMSREKFFDYAAWLFSVILPLTDALPITSSKYDCDGQKRVLGFLGERLFNIWLTKQISNGAAIREVQRVMGYLSTKDQENFRKTYGETYYSHALQNSKKRVLPNPVFDKTVNADNVIVHPSRVSKTPDVSILAPVYNVSPFLRECIESVIHQTLENIEIIFVNDASTDDSLSILMEYYKKDPRIVVIEHKKNEGLPGARNTALRYMRGKYFSCIDSDDICDLTMFEKMYQKAETLQADIVTCCVMGFYDTLENQYLHRQLEWFGDSDRLLSLVDRPQQLMEPAAWCKLFRTSYVTGLDYFEFRPGTRSWEDVPAMTSAFIQTDRIATVQEALYFYRQRSAGNLSSSMTRRNTDEFISGARLQQEILDEHQFFDEGVQSYIEEFKLLFAEWMLSKMASKDIPYLFHHVACLFKFKDRKYLARVFSMYPHRKRFYYVMMTRSSVLYYVGKAFYRSTKKLKVFVKRIFDIHREDVYWTFRLGFVKIRAFKEAYYEQTVAWFRSVIQSKESVIAQSNSQIEILKDSVSQLSKKANDLANRLENESSDKKQLEKQLWNLQFDYETQVKESQSVKERFQDLQSDYTTQSAQLEAVRTQYHKLESACETQKNRYDAALREKENAIKSLNNTVTSLHNEFDGYYHSVWNTGWINIWKDYYNTHFNGIRSKIDRLESGLDPKSIEVIERQCYRMFILLPRQEDADLFRYDHSRIYTPEELEGAKAFFDEFEIRNKYSIPENEYLEVPVFRFRCGLPFFPQEALEQVSGMDVIDGGAFWGDSALVLSEYHPKSIFAFEPQPDTFSHLVNTITDNHMDDLVIPVQKGLGDCVECKTLYTTGMCSGANLQGIMPVVTDEPTQTDTIQITTIDEWAYQKNMHIGLIKLDIEGNELNAIHGALNVIKRDKPLLAISIYHTPTDFFEIKPLIESLNLGYRFMVRKLSYHDLVSEIMLLAYVDKEKGHKEE